MAITVNPVTYCNLTTDLVRAYQNIFDIIAPKQLTDWNLTTGQSIVYQVNQTGYVSAVFQDTTPLTSRASISLVASNVGSFFYDSDNDILYVSCTDSVDPDGNHTIEVGVDKETFIGECRAIAQSTIESILDKRFPRPLPESINTYLGRKYDDDFIQAVAKLTCSIAITSVAPQIPDNSDLASRLRAEAIQVITDHNDGTRSFSFEIVKAEVGSVSILPFSVSGDGMIEVAGVYSGSEDKTLRVKITLAGAVGTATYQYSTDDGSTYNGTSITTAGTWVAMTNSLYIRFNSRGGTFALNDTWKLIAVEESKSITNPVLGSIKIIS